MTYDFDQVVDRRNTGSLKWDIAENELPMWVADMDFQAAPEIRRALQQRLDHGVFGYSVLPESWYEAYQSWWKRRHGLDIRHDELIFCTGVVPAISSMVRKLTTAAEKVLIMTPVYNIFFNSIVNNGRNVLESPLRYENHRYDVDFERLERDLSDPQTSLMILCNPHNPVGKVWDRETLEQIGELCWKHHVIVISDEIHCDLTQPGVGYVPFASVSEHCRQNSISCFAPTKAFNIAGLQTAAVMVPNELLRHRVWRGLNTDEVAEPNAFAVTATVAALTQGGEWLDQLRAYLWENRLTAQEYLAKQAPTARCIEAQGTYLLWLDCGEITDDAEKLADFIRQETGLYVNEGGEYGQTGRKFLRINLACPRSVLMDGLERLARGLGSYTKK